MTDQKLLAAFIEARDQTARRACAHKTLSCEDAKKIVQQTTTFERLKEKIEQSQEPYKPEITTSQWLGAIGFAFSMAAVYYKHKERKKLFEDHSD